MKPALSCLAAALLLVSAQTASAGADGTCPGTSLDELAVTNVPDASTPVPSEAGDYTKVAEATAATRNAVAVMASRRSDPRETGQDSAEASSSRR